MTHEGLGIGIPEATYYHVILVVTDFLGKGRDTQGIRWSSYESSYLDPPSTEAPEVHCNRLDVAAEGGVQITRDF